MFVPIERRISPRWVAVNNQATLEFSNGSNIRRAGASLLDISREGALISTKEAIPLGTPLRFRLESPAKTDWIGAHPVRHAGSLRLGIRFVKPCLDDLLLAAMLGIDLGSLILDGGRPPTFADLGDGG
jgi:hypothetical protein